MQRICRGLLALRDNRQKGVSLIVALCAVAVLLGLSLSLVYAASLPMARANRKIDRERCDQLAQSFAGVLDGELRAYTTQNDKLKDPKNPVSGGNTFYDYANRVLEGDDYAEFDKENPLDTTYFIAPDQDTEGYGHEVVGLRKESAPDAVTDGSFRYEDSSAGTEQAEHAAFIQYRLTVLVQASLHNDSYTYSTEYYRKDSFQPVYTWHGSTNDGQTVFWNSADSNWYTTSNFDSGSLIKPAVQDNEDGTQTTESVTISYTYDQSNITYKVYQPVTQNDNSGGGTDGETS